MSRDRAARESGRHRGRSVPRHYGPYAVGSVRVVVAAVSTVLLLAIGYAWYNYTSLNDNQQVLGSLHGLGEPTPTVTSGPSASSGVPQVDGTAMNILIVGIDSRAGLTAAQKRLLKVGQDDQSTSTDTIMIVHVPADGKKAKLVSIPRDSEVQIADGHPFAKINGAYVDGYDYTDGAVTAHQRETAGTQVLLDTVKSLTGITVDHVVEVGFLGFYDIAKAIGGIDVDLCHAVDDTHVHNVAEGGDGGSGFRMSAGEHHLNAVQSLEFVRQRHNIPGPVTDDFGRELRQRYFLSAAFKSVLSAGMLLNPIKFHKLIGAVDNAFTFDNQDFSIARFAEQMSDLSAGNIVGETIPYTLDSSGNVQVDPAAVRKDVHAFFYGAPATPKPSTSGPSTSRGRSTSPAGSPSSSSSSDTTTPSCID